MKLKFYLGLVISSNEILASNMSKSVLDKLMPLGTIQRRQRNKRESMIFIYIHLTGFAKELKEKRTKFKYFLNCHCKHLKHP